MTIALSGLLGLLIDLSILRIRSRSVGQVYPFIEQVNPSVNWNCNMQVDLNDDRGNSLTLVDLGWNMFIYNTRWIRYA